MEKNSKCIKCKRELDDKSFNGSYALAFYAKKKDGKNICIVCRTK